MQDISPDLIQLDGRHLVHPLTPIGTASRVIIERGEGSWLYGMDGKAYLDGRAQLCCVNLGYGHEGLIEAIGRQVRELPYLSLFYSFGHPQAIRAAGRIAAAAPGDLNHVFFSSGGSESNELALSLVRQFWSQIKPTKQKIISFYESYHGTTAAAMTASGMGMAGMPGVPAVVGGHVHIEPPYHYRRNPDLSPDAFADQCADELAAAIEREGADSVAALIAEPVMGVGGYIPPPDKYWKLVREVCDAFDVLLIFDEVMTGFCRTGNLFAAQTYEVVPDILVMGKGITSNYVPCGGIVFNERIFDAVAGSYVTGVTNSGHPLATAACNAAMDAYETDELGANIASVSDYLMTRLREAADQMTTIGEVSGKGMMIGIDLASNKAERHPVTHDVCQKVVADAQERGLLVRARGSRVCISPPLNLTMADAEILLDRLIQAIDFVLNGERTRMR